MNFEEDEEEMIEQSNMQDNIETERYEKGFSDGTKKAYLQTKKVIDDFILKESPHLLNQEIRLIRKLKRQLLKAAKDFAETF